MSEIRLIEAPLEIVFDFEQNNAEGYAREFSQLAESEQDAIGQWIRVAKAKGETSESDPLLLHLMAELYRKMDRLEKLLTDSGPRRLILEQTAKINRIGLEHFELDQPQMDVGKSYYGRLVLPSLSSKETGIFFEAVSPTLARMSRIRTQDADEWVAYMRARERAMIREMKGTAG